MRHKPIILDTKKVASRPTIAATASVEASAKSAVTEAFPMDYDGVPYETITKHLELLLGGKPVMGGRNNHIYAMACQLRYICDHNAEWVAAVMPSYGEEPAKVKQTCASACSRPQAREMSATIRKALDMAREEHQAKDGRKEGKEVGNYFLKEPPLPQKLPKFVEDAISPFPQYQRAAMAIACFTPLMSYFSATRCRYIDNSWMEPSSMCVLAGEAGKGKGGHKLMCKAMCQQMRESDAKSIEKEDEWREKTRGLGANDQKPPRPKDICVQQLAGDVTKAALTQRQADCYRAGGKFIYSYFSEASMLKGVSNELATLIKLAYDCDEKGAERATAQAESGSFPLRWNFSVSCNKTVLNQTFNFAETLYDGTLQRITFAILPKREVDPTTKGRELVPTYDASIESDYANKLRKYTEAVSKEKGDYESPAELVECSYKRCDEKWDMFQDSEDDFIEDYGNRTIAKAHKIGFTLWVLNGHEWSQEIEDFTKWAFYYMMWASATLLHKAYIDGVEASRLDVSPVKAAKNMLDMLKDTFTYDDLVAVRRTLGKSIERINVHNQLRTWRCRGRIMEAADGTYVKAPRK